MPFTVVTSVMEKNMTSDETIAVFRDRVNKAAESGWSPYGEVFYWTNAVSQVMVSDPIDMETAKAEIEKICMHGSTQTHPLVYRLGGRGHMGEKHWYA